VCRNDTNLIAVRVDDPYFFCPDLAIDVHPVCLSWPSYSTPPPI
jgi:hypothetical protein